MPPLGRYRRPTFLFDDFEGWAPGKFLVSYWGVWSSWGNCARKDRGEKWQKRTRQCWFNGEPLSVWEAANKVILTKKIIYIFAKSVLKSKYAFISGLKIY